MLPFSPRKSTKRKIYFANEQPYIFKVRRSINNPSFGAKCHWSLSICPENIRKPEVFWCYLGVSKETIGIKWVERLLLWKLPVKDISKNFAFPNIALRAVLNKCVNTSVSKLFRYFVFVSTFFSNALTAIFTKCSSTTLLLFSFGLATSWLFFALSFFSSSWKKVYINKVKKPSEKKYITKDLLKHFLHRCLLRILPNE